MSEKLTQDDYLKDCHRMQTGVAYKMERNPSETQPKHLRVGINSAMSNHAALVELLIDKGVITEEEYQQAVFQSMRREADAYEKAINDIYGGNRNITLG